MTQQIALLRPPSCYIEGKGREYKGVKLREYRKGKGMRGKIGETTAEKNPGYGHDWRL